MQESESDQRLERVICSHSQHSTNFQVSISYEGLHSQAILHVVEYMKKLCDPGQVTLSLNSILHL